MWQPTWRAPWRPCDDHRARPHRRPGHERRRQRWRWGGRCARHAHRRLRRVRRPVDRRRRHRPRRRPPTSGSTPADGACCPASSTATRISCSPATVRRSSHRAWPAAHTRPGGINVTVGATRAASDATLRSLAAARRDEGRRAGITTTEIKSGYGLTAIDEARCLRIAGELTGETTFLGAHVVPPEYTDRADAYVEHLCGEMLPACAPHARWIDCVLRDRRVRRRSMPRRARRRAGRRARAPTPRQPAGARSRRRPRRRDGVRLRRSLHVPHRRRRRGAGGRIDRGDVPSGDRLLDPPAVPRRPARDRRRSPVAIATNCNPARATRRRCRSASRSPCATCT